MNHNTDDEIFDDILNEKNSIRKRNKRKNKIDDVNFDYTQHNLNIKRLIMERDNIFNLDSRTNRSISPPNYNNYDNNSYDSNKSANTNNTNNSNDTNHNHSNTNYVGEITGHTIDIRKLDKGMPMRISNEHYNDKLGNPDNDSDNDNDTNYPEISKSINPANSANFVNPHLDFDLYRSKSNINVSYFDPNDNNNQFSTRGTNYSTINDDLESNGRISSETKFSSIINQFSMNMLNKFKSSIPQNKSLLISPFSIYQSMILLYRGSKNKTETELRKVFSFLDKPTTFTTFSKLQKKIIDTKNVHMSNSLYFSDMFPLNQGYTNYVRNLGLIDNINTLRSREESIRINNITTNTTRGNITNLITGNMINRDTLIVVTSAIFFYSRWKHPFLQEYTRIDTFYTYNKLKKVNRLIPIMTQKNVNHNYFEDTSYQILEMDYNDQKLSMGIILPKLNKLINIDNEQLGYYISQLSKQFIPIVRIPKFKQQSKFKIDNLFRKMGLRELFTNADLSEITASNDIMYVTDIIHQVYVVVNEDGSNPLGNTNNATNTNTDTNYAPLSKNKSFIANRPFMYYIRFKPTNTILFIGNYY